MAFTDRLAGEEEMTWGELRHGLTGDTTTTQGVVGGSKL
jgi:hypothetical protein